VLKYLLDVLVMQYDYLCKTLSYIFNCKIICKVLIRWMLSTFELKMLIKKLFLNWYCNSAWVALYYIFKIFDPTNTILLTFLGKKTTKINFIINIIFKFRPPEAPTRFTLILEKVLKLKIKALFWLLIVYTETNYICKINTPH